MATQLVKWWKAKFHVGGCAYKTMAVLGSSLGDDRPSDTEDLVKDDTSSYNNGAHINQGLVSSSTSENLHDCHSELQNHEVNFEDFECDVHVEETESGEERKEFSFTFYDLDGYGKVTKDDVAGLVRSIYGAVNDSIKVPQGGKKTIKVKLTVTPEKSGYSDYPLDCKNNNLSANAMGNAQSSAPESRKLRNNVNVTIQENLKRDRSGSCRKEKDRFCHSDKPKFNSVRLPNSIKMMCQGCQNFSPEVFQDCSASPLRNRKKWRERTCSLQRPDLLDLIQANMEKNNVSPCCRHDHINPKHISQSNYNHNQNPLITSADPSCPVPLFANENFWKQKLADITQNNNNNNFNRNLVTKGHECHHKTSHGNHHQCKRNGHHRSRSHDLSQNIFRYHLLSERDQLVSQPPPGPHQQCCNNHVNSNLVNQEECVELLGGCILNQHLSPRNKNTNITNAASPHQLKHRNREQEHVRSMAQVISWLERENIGRDKRFSSPKMRNPSTPNNAPLSSPPVVKKHEHHHIHEHVHHHYHHYAKETSIIV